MRFEIQFAGIWRNKIPANIFQLLQQNIRSVLGY